MTELFCKKRGHFQKRALPEIFNRLLITLLIPFTISKRKNARLEKIDDLMSNVVDFQNVQPLTSLVPLTFNRYFPENSDPKHSIIQLWRHWIDIHSQWSYRYSIITITHWCWDDIPVFLASLLLYMITPKPLMFP